MKALKPETQKVVEVLWAALDTLPEDTTGEAMMDALTDVLASNAMYFNAPFQMIVAFLAVRYDNYLKAEQEAYENA